MPVEARGIRRVHLVVSDQECSISFYNKVFGMEYSYP